jgi:L-aspartate oxidase
VVLATGGIGHLYTISTNPPQANGAGVALAAEAGAVIADAEFVQFHPTALDIGRDPAPLATEALRGDGAILVNRDGVRFMQAIHPDAELAPRDIVARGVFAEVQSGRGAFLDCREAIGAAFPEKFPTVYGYCRDAGLDPVTQLIPVAPAEHYHMGGVWTDARGRSSLPGLWAAGEVASTGVHGANRLASNSLLEAIVFADRIAHDLKENLPGVTDIPAAPLPVPDGPPPRDEDLERIEALRRLMSARVGVIRDGKGLAQALEGIAAIRAGARSRAVHNMATTALMIAAAASLRRESRGGHYRSDFPDPDPKQGRRSRLTLADALALVPGRPARAA